MLQQLSGGGRLLYDKAPLESGADFMHTIGTVSRTQVTKVRLPGGQTIGKPSEFSGVFPKLDDGHTPKANRWVMTNRH